MLTLFSCAKPQEDSGSDEISISVPLTEVGSAASRQFIKVEASASWSINVNCGMQETWARVDVSGGTGPKSGIILSWDENTDETERECEIALVSRGRKTSATLKQAGAAAPTPPSEPGDPSDISPDTPGAWLELPATNQDDMYFFSHSMTRGDKATRNFSYYYDIEARMAAWVAYPLNTGLKGSGSRTDEWGYDPKLPAKYQQRLFGGYSGSYQRGHQLPSADRYGAGINEKTFYFTNITPQRGALNEQAWAKLEGYVRNWSTKLDTLYVVTGADFRQTSEVAYDNAGTEVPVPTGYYKALLGYKSGSSVANATGGYFGIAFYFDHKGYSDSSIMGSQAMSIDALEDKLGIDFFVNLPAKVGEDVCRTIESSTDKSWWNSNK